MTDADGLLALAEVALADARAGGADEAEVYLWSGRGTEATRGGRVRAAGSSDASGVSVRALVGKRLAFAKTSGLRPQDVAWTVRRALWSAAHAPERATFPHFVEPAPVQGSPAPVHAALADPDPDRLLACVDALADAAAATPEADFHIAGIASHHGLFVVANTRGVRAWDRHAFEGASIEVRCRGTAHKYAKRDVYARGPLDASADLGAIGRDTADLALGSVHPRPLPGTVTDVVLDGACANALLTGLSSAFGGRAGMTGRSRLAGRIDQPVAAEALSLADDPRAPAACRQQRVDDEGVPTAPRPLVEQGVLRGFVFDWASAADLGVAPTGHGLRAISGRYNRPPRTRLANLVVAPGAWSLDEMVASTKRGVLVRGTLLGAFTGDAVTGDFSYVAPTAHYVEGGQIRHSLPSVSISGNVFDALRDIQAVGRDGHVSPGGTSRPLALQGITCVT